MDASITGHIDVAQVVLYTFWLFFAGLIFYLRREDRREGYPLESEINGEPINADSILIPSEKKFKMMTGEELGTMRKDKRDADLRLAPTQGWSGAPFEPTGDPMVDGVGPASWAERRDHVETTYEGHPKIQPVRNLKGYDIADGDVDPRGLPVRACDGKDVGEVTDLWVDVGEHMIRYLEVRLEGETGKEKGSLLLPMTMVRLTGYPAHCKVYSIRSDQFPGVPRTKSKDTVSLLEEERVVAYYSGGYLYAKPSRMGPVI
jgi:photosynthetic reaction center H subunit